MINDEMTTVEVMRALLNFYHLEVLPSEDFVNCGAKLMILAETERDAFYREWRQTSSYGTCFKCRQEIDPNGNLPSVMTLEFKWRGRKHYAAFSASGVTVFSYHSLVRYKERFLDNADTTVKDVFYSYIHPRLNMSFHYLYSGPHNKLQRYLAVADALFIGNMDEDEHLEIDGYWYHTCISALEAGTGQLFLMACLSHQQQFAAECGGDPYNRQDVLLKKRHDTGFRKRFEEFMSIESALYKVGFSLGSFQVAYTEEEMTGRLQSMYRVVRPDTAFEDLLTQADSSVEVIRRDLAYIQSIEE